MTQNNIVRDCKTHCRERDIRERTRKKKSLKTQEIHSTTVYDYLQQITKMPYRALLTTLPSQKLD